MYFDCEKKNHKKNLKAEIDLFVLDGLFGVCSWRNKCERMRTKWGPYVCTYGEIIWTKNKQINKIFSKQSVSFVKPRGTVRTDSPPSKADAIETRTFALRRFQSCDHKLRSRYSENQLCHDISQGQKFRDFRSKLAIFEKSGYEIRKFYIKNPPISI